MWKSGNRSWKSLQLVCVLVILGAYVAWVLSLPCFPSSDGPLHMYYAHVLSALLFHSNPVYARFFRVRHLLPPYSFYYYALIALSRCVPMLLADRIIICVYFLSFIFGFRFLARAVGPSADLMTLLTTLLLLNWPLGSGFVNFCLSLSFSLWATGLWVRIVGTRNLPGRIAFGLMATLTMLTHPVPLLLLLAVTGTILTMRFVRVSLRPKGSRFPACGKADITSFIFAALNLAYVKLFATSHPLQQSKEFIPTRYWPSMLIRIGSFTRGVGLSFMFGRGMDVYLYRGALEIVLIACIFLSVRQRRTNKRAGLWTLGDTFLVIGAGLAIGLPFIPPQLNGLNYFADRLLICVWLAFLLAASGWSPKAGEVSSPASGSMTRVSQLVVGSRSPIAQRTAALTCLLFVISSNTALLFAADRIMRPVADSIAVLDHATLSPPGQLGFITEDPTRPLGRVHDFLSWNPYYWALVHVFRKNNAVLANSPWINESIIPIAPSQELPAVSILALQGTRPDILEDDLLRSPSDLKRSLGAVDFFMTNEYDHAVVKRSPLLFQEPAESAWTCSTDEWYLVCHGASVHWRP